MVIDILLLVSFILLALPLLIRPLVLSGYFQQCAAAILAMALVLGLYAHLGSFQAARQWDAFVVMNRYYQDILLNMGTTVPQIKASIDKINQRLQRHPDEAIGWYLLSEIALGLGDQQTATQYLQRAQTLAPDDLSIQQAEQQLLHNKNEDSQSLTVTVNMASVRQQNLSGTETLFIAVKLPTRPMPLWAKKIAVGKFPMTIQLNHHDAISEHDVLPTNQPLLLTVMLSRDEKMSQENKEHRAEVKWSLPAKKEGQHQQDAKISVTID